ncbi:MAG TPA: hypothetical protein VFK61_07985 [Candidatus Limnocylindria bacterium]|jgi:hypothetical protein|nr:hypothetical protein [Candidatus Limnocylindria bacterium]
MTRRAALVAVMAGGLLLLAGSFLDGWITHQREVRGEGYRLVTTLMSAWRSPVSPVLPIGIASGVFATVAAAAALLVPVTERLSWRAIQVAAAASAGALAVVAAQLVPLGQDGRTSSVDLYPAWAAFAGLLLTAAMLALAWWALRPALTATGARRMAVVVAALGLVIAAVAVAGRQVSLLAANPTGEHWSDGTYVRPATGDQPEETLVISDGHFQVGDRWSGTWSGKGLSIIIEDDPACPEARGAYHAHDEGPDGADLRFVALLDRCADGERQQDLETGIWERQD